MESDKETSEKEVTEKEETPKDMNYPNQIRNKMVRRMHVLRQKKLKVKAKKEARKKRRMLGEPKQIPKTIENMRIKDETMLREMSDDSVEEVQQEFEKDEFSSYFQKSYEPKVLITFSDNPCEKTRIFGRELSRVIPNSLARYRNRSGVKKMVKSCIAEGYTDLLVINENKKEPNGLLVIHLPGGPTAHFRLSNAKLTTDLKRDYKEISEHRPEVILNNFSTHLGNTVARMLASLFHYDPQFRGRRAVTFHNQRDYIFFRHHRYQFSPNGKARLQELGPRFTLKLRSLQLGTFDSKTGEYEWMITGRRHEMETSRRKFFL